MSGLAVRGSPGFGRKCLSCVSCEPPSPSLRPCSSKTSLTSSLAQLAASRRHSDLLICQLRSRGTSSFVVLRPLRRLPPPPPAACRLLQSGQRDGGIQFVIGRMDRGLNVAQEVVVLFWGRGAHLNVAPFFRVFGSGLEKSPMEGFVCFPHLLLSKGKFAASYNVQMTVITAPRFYYFPHNYGAAPCSQRSPAHKYCRSNYKEARRPRRAGWCLSCSSWPRGCSSSWSPSTPPPPVPPRQPPLLDLCALPSPPPTLLSAASPFISFSQLSSSSSPASPLAAAPALCFGIFKQSSTNKKEERLTALSVYILLVQILVLMQVKIILYLLFSSWTYFLEVVSSNSRMTLTLFHLAAVK